MIVRGFVPSSCETSSCRSVASRAGSSTRRSCAHSESSSLAHPLASRVSIWPQACAIAAYARTRPPATAARPLPTCGCRHVGEAPHVRRERAGLIPGDVHSALGIHLERLVSSAKSRRRTPQKIVWKIPSRSPSLCTHSASVRFSPPSACGVVPAPGAAAVVEEAVSQGDHRLEAKRQVHGEPFPGRVGKWGPCRALAAVGAIRTVRNVTIPSFSSQPVFPVGLAPPSSLSSRSPANSRAAVQNVPRPASELPRTAR